MYSVWVHTRFSQQDHPRILGIVHAFDTLYPELGWCGVWCSNNALHAMSIHPEGKRTKSLKDFVASLSKRQQRDGTWKGRPFYQTFHGMSLSGVASAGKQIRASIPTILKRQRSDGSWEAHTFLVLRALNQLGLWK